MRSMVSLLLGVLLLSTPLLAKKPTNIYVETWKSIVLYRIGEDNHCTAFAVRFDPMVYITASHCFGEGTPLGTIDGIQVVPVLQVGEATAVTVPNGKSHPMLILGGRPALGELVTGLGFGGPVRFPFMYQSMYLGDGPVMTDGKVLAATQSNYVGGMSGGPIINAEGHVVSIIQCGGNYGGHNADFGCGSTYDETLEIIQKVTSR